MACNDTIIFKLVKKNPEKISYPNCKYSQGMISYKI